MHAIRNLCMAFYRHASTGSNMKTFSFYPGSSPQQRSKGTWLKVIMLVLAPFTFTKGAVTITCPPTITIDCSVNPIPANTGSATATTNCPTSSNVTITYSDNPQMTGCMGTGTIIRTWRATDQCGAVATCIQSITVEDNTSPTLTCPSFKIISCESDTTPANLGFAQAVDNCTPSNLISISYEDHTDLLNLCNGTGSFTRHWTAVDMCGNVAACIQTIVIVDNTAPTLQLPPSLTISCDQSSNPQFTGFAEAIDNCTPVNQLVITFSDNVLGLTGCSGTGTIVRSWYARDACFNIASGTQFITIVDNTPPSITSPNNITISCEASMLPANTGSMTASDLCGSVFTGYTDLVIQQTCNGTGSVQRTWTAIDGCGNISSAIQMITIIDTTVPTVTPPANITVDCAQGVLPVVTGSPVRSDNCTPAANLIVTYADIETVPLTCNGTGILQRTWTVADACGNTTTCVQMISITDLLKPTITSPPPATISCESSVLPAVTGTATASDNCTSANQIVIHYVDDQSGLFGCNNTGLLRRTWSATDLCGNTTTAVQMIWIVDEIDPVLTVPANVEISCSDSSLPATTGNASATDNCTLTPEISYADVSQLNDCNNTGLIFRTWSARDACGNVKTGVQVITVVDKTAPLITCPRDTIIDCGFYNNPDALGYPKGIDNCTPSDELILDYDDDLTGLTGCTNTGVILRTWYMTDLCGNTGSCVQRITVADTTKPTIICPPNTVISCNASTLPASNGKATATDYCTASLFIKITYTDDLSQAGQCNGSGFIYRTWRAEDQCNNVATCVQTIEIIDDIAPEIQCPASYAIQCDADRSPAAQGTAKATDNCTAIGDIAITYTDDVSSLTGCNGTGNLYRTWQAADLCGNTTTCVQVLTIVDSKKPTAVPPAPITISCETSLDPSITGSVTASDNCTAVSELSITISDDDSAIV